MAEFITAYSAKRDNSLDIYFNEIVSSIKKESEMIDRENERNEMENMVNLGEKHDASKGEIKLILPYYSLPKPKKIVYDYFYTYAPSNTRIQRVPPSVLGENILGRAILSLNLIQIREDLYGLDFEEVKKHEINHILYPNLTEWEIRQKTKTELPFYARFH